MREVGKRRLQKSLPKRQECCLCIFIVKLVLLVFAFEKLKEGILVLDGVECVIGIVLFAVYKKEADIFFILQNDSYDIKVIHLLNKRIVCGMKNENLGIRFSQRVRSVAMNVIGICVLLQLKDRFAEGLQYAGKVLCDDGFHRYEA